MDFNTQNILGMIARNQVNPRGAIAYQDQMKQQEAQQRAMEAQKLQQAQQATQGQQLLNRQRQQALQQAGQPQYQRVQGRDGNLYEVQVGPNGQLLGQPRPVQGLGQPQRKIPEQLIKHLPPELQVNPQAASNADLVAAAKKAQDEASRGRGGFTGVKDGQGYNPDTNQIEKVPVSPEIANQREQERAKFADQQRAGFESTKAEIEKAIGLLDKDQGEMFSSSGGSTGAAANYLPFLDGYGLARAIDTVQANLAFDKLQAIREASKTGGGLGAVSERELALLSSAVASLDAGLPADQKRANLVKVMEHYQRFIDSLNQGGQGVQLPRNAETQGQQQAPTKVLNFDIQGNPIQ